MFMRVMLKSSVKLIHTIYSRKACDTTLTTGCRTQAAELSLPYSLPTTDNEENDFTPFLKGNSMKVKHSFIQYLNSV